MNLILRWLCGSARWKKVVETYILPWTLEGLNLGSDVLKVGPGPDSRRRRLDQVNIGPLPRSLAGRDRCSLW